MKRFVNLAAAIVILGAMALGAFAAVRALTTSQDEDMGPGLVVDHRSLPALPGNLNTPGSGDKASYRPPVDASQWPAPEPSSLEPSLPTPTSGSPAPQAPGTSTPPATQHIQVPPKTKSPVAPLPPSPADHDDEDDDDEDDEDDEDDD